MFSKTETGIIVQRNVQDSATKRGRVPIAAVYRLSDQNEKLTFLKGILDADMNQVSAKSD